jgi:aspartate racemase
MNALKEIVGEQKEYPEENKNSATELFVFPASFPQQGLWLVDRLTGTTVNYTIPMVFRIQGKLDADILEAAINAVILRHEILRTYFIEQDGEPMQVIQSLFSMPLTRDDLRGYPEEQRIAEAARLIQETAATSFSLDQLPLLKTRLLCLGDEEYRLLFVFHHIIFDGWSLDVFARDLSALYEAFSRGRPSPLPELPIQYADYAAWQREQWQDEAMEGRLDYWKSRLAGLPTLELPTDRPRPAVQALRGKSQRFSLPSGLTEELNVLGRREGATLFMTLLAAFQALLHRYSGQDDIAVGTPNAGRGRLELEGLIGFFVNTLVLRVDLSGDPSFRELLARVRDVALGAYTHQDMPFEKLVEALNPQRDPGCHPLFQVMFVLQNTSDDTLMLNGTRAEPLPVDTGTTQFDLTLELSETPQGLTGKVEYATALFEAATIERLIGHFQMLLEGIVARPEARLSELPLLTASERRQLLVEWNSTEAPFPRDQCIHALFEARAAATPEAAAVIYEDSQLSYAELNAQANRLAHYLRELGVGPDARVAICVERGLNMVVGLLAILKAGGAYVPLDPAYPRERLAFMLEDSAPAALLTQGRLENLFEDMAKTVPVLDLDAKFPPWAGLPDTDPDHGSVKVKPGNLAYVIYTSGSTGKPKGVMVEHKALCNLITDVKNRYGIGAEDRILQFGSIAFDMSMQDIFGALLMGAALVLRGEDWLAGASKFWGMCAKNRVSIITLPTLFWQQLVQEEHVAIPGTIRHVTIGGEAVDSNVLAAWFEREGYRPTLFNGYGPTETTIYSTSHKPLADSLSRQAIGRPIANTSVYILDAHRQPVPIGVMGELYIGGAGVTRGYLNQPELTAERFMHDPFTAKADARMYKTGDLARRLADGTIEFRGRNDFQVKIRGFRIELGEIEAALRRHPQLREVAVGVHEPAPGDKRLVAYGVARDAGAPSAAELRDFLKPKLPEFMTPSAFVFLDALPMTPNGKLDRKALPEPDQGRHVAEIEFMAPRTPLQQQLADLWAEVLKIGRISMRDNFFELGGHSLLAVNVIVKVNERFNVRLPLGALYQAPTIEELENLLASGDPQPAWYSLVPIQTQGSRPPLFAIHTLTLVDLPRYLGKQQPLYFLRYGMAAEPSERSVPLPRLEDLAGHYIEEMQKLQPSGPYYLIGFSFGGIIAYEMACQLRATGHPVNLVGLLDTYLMEKKQLLPLPRILHNIFKKRARDLLAWAKTHITDLALPYKYGTDFWPHIYTEAPDITCKNGYQPKTYNGQVTLFKAWESESMVFNYAPIEQAWAKILGDKLDVQWISGSHFEIFQEPHVKVLAESIKQCMDKVSNNGD